MNNLEFRAIQEDAPSHKIRQEFEKNWPSYRNWFLIDGEAARPRYLDCRTGLKRHMPELLPLYDQLLELFECDDEKARFLSLYRPPPFAAGCSQLIWQTGTNALIRNYDFPAWLCEGTVIKSRWLEKEVIAMADCVWGALDGINEDGLAISLAFGGDAAEGEGFGVSLVMRYVLETCSNTAEAIAVLQRVPVHMAYNIAILDAAGSHSTVLIAPGKEPVITDRQVSTNRQGLQEVPRYTSLSDTIVREDYLARANAEPGQTLLNMIRNFCRPPLYRWHRENPSGTLYTAVYYPDERRVDYLWPERHWSFSIAHFSEQQHRVCYE